MTASTVALIGSLCHAHRRLLPLLAEHLDDNEGEVLPHLVLSDVVRWLSVHEEDRAEVWAWLGRAYEDGDEEERALIVASGVEMIPDPGEPGSEQVHLLGPVLRRFDPWGR